MEDGRSRVSKLLGRPSATGCVGSSFAVEYGGTTGDDRRTDGDTDSNCVDGRAG